MNDSITATLPGSVIFAPYPTASAAPGAEYKVVSVRWSRRQPVFVSYFYDSRRNGEAPERGRGADKVEVKTGVSKTSKGFLKPYHPP